MRFTIAVLLFVSYDFHLINLFIPLCTISTSHELRYKNCSSHTFQKYEIIFSSLKWTMQSRVMWEKQIMPELFLWTNRRSMPVSKSWEKEEKLFFKQFPSLCNNQITRKRLISYSKVLTKKELEIVLQHNILNINCFE
jgi:hypothetical protein